MVGEVKTKKTYKEEIITMIKEIEDYKILRILHEFVKSFFSNYCFGIPFRNTFFMKYSMKNMRKTLRMRYYEITSLKGVDEVYDGYYENYISNLIKRMNDMVDLPTYISDNKNKFDIK